MATLGERLKQLRAEKNVLQKDLAALLDVSIRAYQFYESGDREPNIEGLQKLADFFEVSIDYLTGRTNHWIDAEGRIVAKIPPDIYNLDTEELKRQLEDETDKD